MKCKKTQMLGEKLTKVIIITFCETSVGQNLSLWLSSHKKKRRVGDILLDRNLNNASHLKLFKKNGGKSYVHVV